MIKLNSIFLTLIVLVFLSCDPESCRDCDTFNHDLEGWSIGDDTLQQELIFVDVQMNEYTFRLDTSFLSLPYNECQLVSSPADVACNLTKKNRYLSDEWALDFAFAYEQFEVPNGDIASNEVFYSIQIKEYLEDGYLETIKLDILRPESINIALAQQNEIALGGQEYKDVLVMEIEKMKVLNSTQEVSPKILNRVYFKPPLGIVKLDFIDGRELILKKQ